MKFCVELRKNRHESARNTEPSFHRNRNVRSMIIKHWLDGIDTGHILNLPATTGFVLLSFSRCGWILQMQYSLSSSGTTYFASYQLAASRSNLRKACVNSVSIPARARIATALIKTLPVSFLPMLSRQQSDKQPP